MRLTGFGENFSGEAPPVLHKANENSNKMNFVGAAEAHVLLFGQLKDFVHGEMRGLSVKTAHGCEIERWLELVEHTEVAQLQAYAQLRDAHHEFHRYALALVEQAEMGDMVAAEVIRKSGLSQSLRGLLVALTELHDAIAKQPGLLN